MDKDWRQQGIGERCNDCQYKDLCNRRSFVLEVAKLFVTPRMVFALTLMILTIFQIISGGV